MSTAPEGRKLLRVEARNAEVPIEKKPHWIKTKAIVGPEYNEMRELARGQGLHTVCEEAGCPNIYECWEDREATSAILRPASPSLLTTLSRSRLLRT